MKNSISLYEAVSLPEMEKAALEVLHSGKIANGEYVKKFEDGFGELIGAANVVTTIDMTSAMYLALHLAGVNAGDEVLTTAFACLATNSAIAQKKARPIWVDINRDSLEIDFGDLASKISEKTKVLILYHAAGYPGPAKDISTWCKNKGIILIEDCDNALFAERDSAMVGSHGDFSIYSFYPNRQINATEGGALVCRNSDDAKRARKLRRFGIDSDTFRTIEGEINPESDVPEIGWAMTMNNLCAAIAYTQLATAKARVEQNRANANKLNSMINGVKSLCPISIPDHCNPAYWVYFILLENRDAVLRKLKAKGVAASAVHQRNDLYTGFDSRISKELVNTRYIQDHILAIPCGWWLQDKDLFRIADELCAATK